MEIRTVSFLSGDLKDFFKCSPLNSETLEAQDTWTRAFSGRLRNSCSIIPCKIKGVKRLIIENPELTMRFVSMECYMQDLLIEHVLASMQTYDVKVVHLQIPWSEYKRRIVIFDHTIEEEMRINI